MDRIRYPSELEIWHVQGALGALTMRSHARDCACGITGYHMTSPTGLKPLEPSCFADRAFVGQTKPNPRHRACC